MRPSSTEELAEIVAAAAASGRKLEIVGGGTRAEIGAPREALTLLFACAPDYVTQSRAVVLGDDGTLALNLTGSGGV